MLWLGHSRMICGEGRRIELLVRLEAVASAAAGVAVSSAAAVSDDDVVVTSLILS